MKPINYGKILVNQCQKVDITKLVKSIKINILKDLIKKSDLKIEEDLIKFDFSKTGFGGSRIWFLCPICNKRVRIIYKYPTNNKIGCRKCLNLDYISHKYKGMI